jgi:riboflavin kinase/FMN adenylyltransferase
MIVLNDIRDLSRLKGPIALAIGVFDGLHLGHQEVIRDAMDFAQTHGGTAVVLTFDPHPIRFLRPQLAPKLVCSNRHWMVLMKRFGLSHALVLPFTEEVARTSASVFVERLVRSSDPLGFISVGYDWAFGKGREGNIHRLMELGQEHGFGVYGVPSVKVNGEVVSSTLIRETLRVGDLNKTKNLLGRDYSILGEVIKGKQLGRTLGFPTANIRLGELELPPTGVYAVNVRSVADDSIMSKGVANLGYRPTVDLDASMPSLEVNLFDFSSDLYGVELEVSLVQKIRNEQKFASLEELKSQILTDAEIARAIAQR